MRVKIFLEPGETQHDADHALQKAFELHSTGEAHEEVFSDPAMAHVAQRMEESHNQVYADMIREIIEELEKEYSE